MKKNMLSIIILALLLVNIILTSVMMFSVTSTNKKVADLVGNIALVMNLELTPPGQEGAQEAVSLADTQVYVIPNAMTISLMPETVTNANGGQESKRGYFVCNISLSMNKKHKDFKKNGTDEAMAEREELIKDAIFTVVSRHTTSELQADSGLEGLKAEILAAVQELYSSDFIYKVSISEVKYG